MRAILRAVRVIRSRDDERGMALAAVIGIGMVVMILAATMVAVATSGAVTTTSDSNYANAMSAAYAGLADYQAKINANNAYATTYGLTTAPFSSGDKFAGGTGSNPAFTGWVSVPDATGADGPTSYRYAVDNSIYAQQGLVRVQVTGRSGNVTRTLVANVKPNGFSNYLYWTNFESGDPAVTGEKCENVIQNSTFSNQPVDGSAACTYIQFAPGDTLSGPVHSNDELLICGGEFKSIVESAVGWSSSKCGSGSTSPKFDKPGYPTVVSTQTAPASIASATTQMYSDNATVAASSVGTGCLFTGPTKIVLNADGTMNVMSPLTVVTNLQSTAPYGSTPSKCGSISALHSSAGATLSQSLLANNLVYVQSEPSSTSDPNYYKKYYTTSSSTPACFTANGSSTNGVGYPWTSTTTTTQYFLGIPYTSTSTVKEGAPINTSSGTSSKSSSSLLSTAYGCSDGDLFIQGTYTQAMTFDADNYIYVTGDVVYPSNRKASTVLGLVGQNAVFVWNPVDTNGNLMLSDSSRTIDASILSNAGTFIVQNFARGGSRGTLNVSGSIAQEYRGAVGTGNANTGYLKNYGYDTSLENYTPPFFPQPTVTTYNVASQVEVKPAYDSSGNPT